MTKPIHSGTPRPGAAGQAAAAAMGRAAPADDSRAFQSALKNRRGAPPAPPPSAPASRDRRAESRRPPAEASPTPCEDGRQWQVDDPRRGLAHVCTWKDPGAGGDGAGGGGASAQGDDGQTAAAAAVSCAPQAGDAKAGAVPVQAGPPPAQQAPAALEGQTADLVLPRMEWSNGARGEFQILLPAGRSVGVFYDVSPEVTHVLLQGGSRGLSRRLQACAPGIGAELSRRSGRRVEVMAS